MNLFEAGANWPAPAKINLFLHITGRRSDGYHLLQTAFQFLDYGDQLSFQTHASGEINLSPPLAGVTTEENLVWRAARRLQQATKCSKGVDITLEKKILAGGGLGGGSSDAATTLVALNHLWQLQLSQTELLELGLSLGADLPVFILGEAAWAEGVGEKLTPISPDEPWYLVVHPGISVATAEIFSSQELTRDCQAITIRALNSGNTSNVCEAVVFNHYPAVKEVADWLSQWSPARMSGTGASVFAPFSERGEAEEVLAQVRSNWHGFVARGVNRSPLLRRLEQARD
ncbi:MAG: 4-(cytidine 5'-diphospho)-2-C-methyl-D-erythritol kinase [Gammaproteobacteria bacterium]|nr:4-(cytidine 5'-diphospho)-2-C-methyl-D-erythritol kinase [Gammaproteobacteria bacterium]